MKVWARVAPALDFPVDFLLLLDFDLRGCHSRAHCLLGFCIVCLLTAAYLSFFVGLSVIFLWCLSGW